LELFQPGLKSKKPVQLEEPAGEHQTLPGEPLSEGRPAQSRMTSYEAAAGLINGVMTEAFMGHED